jgi:FMN phosphatase YigB (HAD superfamily)
MQAIVFDFGNVIGFFDHRITTRRLAAYGDLSAEELFARLYGGVLEDDYERGRLTTAEFIAHACEHCRLRCSEEQFAQAWADVFWPNDEVIALLPELGTRYRLLLGSNTNELHSRRFCQQFADSFRHFQHLVLSFQVGARKPDASFFHHCERLAGYPASECLFIDDLPDNVAGARACGWNGIVYSTAAELRQQLAQMMDRKG